MLKSINMASATTAPLEDKSERVFYYYPGVSKKKPRRVVLAGIVRGNQILVAEATAYPGKKPTLIAEKQVDTVYGPATQYTFLNDRRPADNFSKKRGRGIALDRARGYSVDANGKKTPCKQKLVMTIDIPEGEFLIGRLFVSKVTEKYPAKGRSTIPGKAKESPAPKEA